MKKTQQKDVKAEVLDFVKGAIEVQKRQGWKGAHVVYSGLNDAIRKLFNVDPRAIIAQLRDEGKLVVKTARGGAIVYLPGEAPTEASKADNLIAAVRG
jgi:hypothetical protein